MNTITPEFNIQLFSENIKCLRKQKNLTQNGVAKQVYVSRPLYASFETGKRKPPLDVLVRLSNLFETPVDVLLTKKIVTTTTFI